MDFGLSSSETDRETVAEFMGGEVRPHVKNGSGGDTSL